MLKEFLGIKEKHTILVKGTVNDYAQGRIGGLVEALVGIDNFKDVKLYDVDGAHIMTAIHVNVTRKTFNQIWVSLTTNFPDACLFDM